jgi:hypothetical protein
MPWSRPRSSFAWNALGALLLISGIASGIYLLGAPVHRIVVVILVAAGVRVLMGVGKTRPKDPPRP